jgi:hypothetical protein
MKVKLFVLFTFGLLLTDSSFTSLNACPTSICEIDQCEPIEEECYESDEE